MTWIGLTGRAQSGKTTAASYLETKHRFKPMAFADPLRDMALDIDPLVAVEKRWKSPPCAWVPELIHYSTALERYGYEGAKERYPEFRRFLQRLGTEGLRRHDRESYWVDRAVDRAYALGQRRVVFHDVRFPNEAEAVQEAGGIIVRIERKGIEAADASHASEALVDTLPVDWTVENDGSLEELYEALNIVVAAIPNLTNL